MLWLEIIIRHMYGAQLSIRISNCVSRDSWDLKDPKEIRVTWETLVAKVLW